MSKIVGVVSALNSREVTTRFGKRNTFNITVDGQPYQLGFGKPTMKVGDTVEFEFAVTSYGNEVVKGSLVVVGAPGALPVHVPTAAVPIPAARQPAGVLKSAGGYERVFPVPALSPERAIIRQNALTQARELVIETQPATTTSTWADRQNQHDNLADEIIRVARAFEAYATGDLDAGEAKKEVASKTKE